MRAHMQLPYNSNYERISYLFEILINLENGLFSFPTLALFDAPAQGNPSEFLDET